MTLLPNGSHLVQGLTQVLDLLLGPLLNLVDVDGLHTAEPFLAIVGALHVLLILLAEFVSGNLGALSQDVQSVGGPLVVQLGQMGLVPHIGVGGLVELGRVLGTEGRHDGNSLRHVAGGCGRMRDVAAL